MTNKTNKWMDFILYGGDIPTLDTPTVEYPIGFDVIGEKGCYTYAGMTMHSDDCECQDAE